MPHHKLFSLLGEEDKVPRREQQGRHLGWAGGSKVPLGRPRREPTGGHVRGCEVRVGLGCVPSGSACAEALNWKEAVCLEMESQGGRAHVVRASTRNGLGAGGARKAPRTGPGPRSRRRQREIYCKFSLWQGGSQKLRRCEAAQPGSAGQGEEGLDQCFRNPGLRLCLGLSFPGRSLPPRAWFALGAIDSFPLLRTPAFSGVLFVF